jgi:two-component system LytT family response regulator
MLKLLIADDEENVQETISAIVEKYCRGVSIVACTASVSATVKAIQQYEPEIVLLDIEMKEGTGFDVLKKITDPKFRIIFVTAYQEYAVEAFRFSALDYILKPIDQELLVQAIKKASESIDREKLSLKIDSFMFNMDHISKEMKKIALKTADNIHLVNLRDIVYCEADRSYTYFYLNDKSRVTVSSPLGQYEDLFNGYGFLRIHSSFLVNINYIKRYEKGDGGKVIIDDKTSLPVSTRKKEQLMQLLSKL